MTSDSLSEERSCFHAVSIALEGEYSRLKKLREKYAAWAEAWEAVRSAHSRINPATLKENLGKLGISVLLPEDPAFPASLREIPFPPFALYCRGTLPGASRPALAVVGTRKATQSGRVLAGEIAESLASSLVIVSGLALGIDAAAHAGCLKGKGTTLAVLAGGLESIHPRTNESLASQILASGGALLSEYPPGSPPVPRRFLERNRLVSGLSLGTLVIEAPEGSGALATARFALDQNRDVFVIPGPVTHPNFRGSHALLRKGARLVRSAEDVLEDLEITPPSATRDSLLSASLGKTETAVLNALKTAREGLSVDALAEKTALEIPAVNRALSFLLVENMVQETEDRYILNS